MELQSNQRVQRAEKRIQAQKEAEKAKRKRPGKYFVTHHIPNPISDNVNRELFQLLGDLDPQMVPVEEL